MRVLCIAVVCVYIVVYVYIAAILAYKFVAVVSVKLLLIAHINIYRLCKHI